MIKNMLFLQYVPLSHMWYMPMIVGLYVFIPFVANAIQSVSTKALILPLFFSGVILFVLPVFSAPTILDMNFSGGIYGLMMISGYLVWKQSFKKYDAKLLIGLGVMAFAITIGTQYFAYYFMHGFNVWYNCATLVFCSLVIFELCTRITHYSFASMIYDLSRCSFGIYLIHNPILLIILRYFPLQGLLPIRVLILWTIVFIMSWFIVHFISKVPKVGKYLFFIN